MSMTMALQVALFLASITFSLLAACLVPIAFQMRRQLNRLALSAEHLEANVALLVQDSREMVRSVNEITRRAQPPVDDAARVLRLARQWTERADRLVDEVGSVIEPPVYSLVRSLGLFGEGASTFIRAVFHNNNGGNAAKKEDGHV